MRIAVLGMGRMGHAVAARLLEGGHELTVWNRSPGRAGDLAAKGATDLSGQAASGAVSGAEVVITSLGDDAAVEAVVINGGVARALSGGATGKTAILVDMSTVSPTTSRQLAQAVGGEQFVASPILGAPAGVESGEAFYLIAGPSQPRKALAPVFSTLAGRQVELGDDPGTALVVKLLSNAQLLSQIAVLAEVVATAQAVGLDDDFLRLFLGSSPLVAPALRNRLDNMIAGRHTGWFTTALGAKDVRLAEDMAVDLHLRTPVIEAVKRSYDEAAAAGWADDDVTAVIESVRHGKSPRGSSPQGR
jgi:3-hydroxyisobutyrate dehydrogenase-like beta-hydroxyacid dehydrogenase